MLIKEKTEPLNVRSFLLKSYAKYIMNRSNRCTLHHHRRHPAMTQTGVQEPPRNESSFVSCAVPKTDRHSFRRRRRTTWPKTFTGKLGVRRAVANRSFYIFRKDRLWPRSESVGMSVRLPHRTLSLGDRVWSRVHFFLFLVGNVAQKKSLQRRPFTENQGRMQTWFQILRSFVPSGRTGSLKILHILDRTLNVKAVYLLRRLTYFG